MKETRIFYNKCPLCDSDDLRKAVIGDCSKHALYKEQIPSTMQWMDCQICYHQFVDGYFNKEALDLIFEMTHDNQKVGYQIEKQRFISSRIVEKIITYKSNGLWLDIGFGNGSLIFTAKEYGFKVVGVDLRKDNVEALRNLGIEAYCDKLENVDFKTKISVASLMDVLEHIPYPKQILKVLYSKMEESGYLIISMPNSESILWKLMSQENQNPYLGEIEHYHNFSRTRLFELLEECGFKIVKYGISERYRVCMEIIASKNNIFKL